MSLRVNEEDNVPAVMSISTQQQGQGWVYKVGI